MVSYGPYAKLQVFREEYANLEEFIKSKKIKMKNDLNEETTVTYAELGDDSEEDEDVDSRRKRRRKEEVATYRDDEDEDEESRKFRVALVFCDAPSVSHFSVFVFFKLADEDFAPGSDSEVAEEFDSNASASDNDDAVEDED